MKYIDVYIKIKGRLASQDSHYQSLVPEVLLNYNFLLMSR